MNNSTFVIDGTTTSGSDIKASLASWTQAWPTSWFESLRQVKFHVCAERWILDHWPDGPINSLSHTTRSLEISFSESAGMQIKAPLDLEPRWREMLKDACAKVEARRKLKDLKGEAVLQF